MTTFGINITNTNYQKYSLETLTLEQICTYLPHELLEMFKKSCQFQLLNSNSSVMSVLRFEEPIICIVANGENNVLELLKCTAEEEGRKLKELDAKKDADYYKSFA